MNTRFKKIWNIITWIIVGIVVVLAILLGGIRVFGITPYAVLSGSMEPVYKVGSLIYVADTDPEKIEVGDPITFRLTGSETAATHRVIEIDSEQKLFYTKGDANADPDSSPVKFDSLIGKPLFTIPLLGYLSNIIKSIAGIPICICVCIIIMLFIFLPDILGKASEGKK